MTFSIFSSKKTKQCPNKNCRSYKRGMENIAKLCRDFDNWYCRCCGCHYAGYNGKLKFYTAKEWDKQFEPEFDKSRGGRDFFPR